VPGPQATGHIERALGGARSHNPGEHFRVAQSMRDGVIAEDFRGSRELFAHPLLLLPVSWRAHLDRP
jgi:hypothetical protein